MSVCGEMVDQFTTIRKGKTLVSLEWSFKNLVMLDGNERLELVKDGKPYGPKTDLPRAD